MSPAPDSAKTPTIDDSRVAVFHERSQEDLDETLSGLGFTPGSATPLVVKGWFLVPTGPTRTSRETVSLLADRGVFTSPVFFDRFDGPLIVTPYLHVQFEAGVSTERARAALATVGADVEVADWANMRGAYRARHRSRDGFDVLAAVAKLQERPDVRFVEPDYMFTGRSDHIPNDPDFPMSWGLHNTGQDGGLPDADMDAPEAWDVTTGDPGILVLILDDGVEQDHPDLNQVPGADFTSDGGDGGPVNVLDNHGTAVAGCVSSVIDNGLGTAGVAPTCRVASARPFISNGPTTWMTCVSWTVEALDWGQSIGARVSNNSNGYGLLSQSPFISQKYADTRAAGMVHFASAGNDSGPPIWYPSRLCSVNAVSALDRFGVRADFSSYGSGTAFCAPGAEIWTTDRTGAAGYTSGDYVNAYGTSFASPYAAGVAALALSVDPSLNASEVERLLRDTASDAGSEAYDFEYGWGVVNAHRAVLPTPRYSVETTLQGDVVSAGAVLRGVGSGTIALRGIPSGATVAEAYLYWSVVTDPADLDISADFNGVPIVGERIGSSASPCWLLPQHVSYRADVTALVPGDGDYCVAVQDSGRIDETPSAQGASLVVLYHDPEASFRQVLILDGNELLDHPECGLDRRFTDLAISTDSNVRLTYLVADGQPAYGDTVGVNGVTFGGDDVFQAFWEDRTFDVSVLVAPGSTTVDATVGSVALANGHDCLVWVAAILSVESACDEAATNYCSTSPNSVGPGASIGSSGSTSVSDNELVLVANGLPPSQFGIFFYGPEPALAFFGNGLLCVGTGSVGTFRLDPSAADGAGGASQALDVTAPPSATGQIVAGETWYFQFWYRDPLGGGSQFNLSDGLEVPFCP